MRVPLKTLFMLLLVGVSFPMLAQSSKAVAYVNLQLIQKQLPAYVAAKAEIETFSKQTTAALSQKEKELEQKYKSSSPHTDMAARHAVLERESQAYYQLVGVKQREIIEKKEKTLATVDEKVKKAIQEVAREKGYSGVMDATLMVYYEQSEDITDSVLAKLGVK